MPELTEAQKKRYEEVREWLAKIMYEQNEFETAHLIWLALSDHARARWFYRADQILSDPDSHLSILDENQELPVEKLPERDSVVGLTMISFAKRVQTNMLESNFRRVLPK